MNRAEFLKKAFLGLSATIILPRLLNAETEIPEGEYLVNPHYVTSGNGFGNRIALTFDDGPHPKFTEIILKELDKYQMRATFFMVGKNVDAYPSIAKEVADAGHEIGNHSYSHPMFTRLSTEKVDAELQKTQDAVYNATGKTPLWLRPPYGAFDKARLGHIPLAKGLGIAYWSVDPMDWKQPGVDVISSRVLNSTTPGAIVLLHDIHQQTTQALPAILEGLQEKAFSLANITRFLGQPYV